LLLPPSGSWILLRTHTDFTKTPREIFPPTNWKDIFIWFLLLCIHPPPLQNLHS
jgi:hypothetical protein